MQGWNRIVTVPLYMQILICTRIFLYRLQTALFAVHALMIKNLHHSESASFNFDRTLVIHCFIFGNSFLFREYKATWKSCLKVMTWICALVFFSPFYYPSCTPVYAFLMPRMVILSVPIKETSSLSFRSAF